MFCVHCGKPCGSDDAYCPHCGGSIPPELRDSTDGPPAVSAAHLKPRRGLLGLALLGVIVGVAAVIALVVLTRRPAKEEPPASRGIAAALTFDPSRYSPSVLTLHCFDDKGVQIGQGSGFVMRADGVAVSNWHVAKDAHSMTATNGTGQNFSVAKVINLDETNDLVVLQLSAEEGQSPVFVPLQPADARTVAPGQRVYTLSAPQGLSQTVTDGVLSAVRSAEGQQLLQFTAAISPGSSGGPVFNERGEVIGVVMGMLTTGQQLNFAIPIDVALRLLAEPARPSVLASSPADQDRKTRQEPIETLFQRGVSAYRARRYVEAARWFERVLTVAPNNSAALFNAGLTYAGQEDFDKAIRSLRGFLENAPSDDEDIARARELIAEFEKARDDRARMPKSPRPTSGDPPRRSVGTEARLPAAVEDALTPRPEAMGGSESVIWMAKRPGERTYHRPNCSVLLGLVGEGEILKLTLSQLPAFGVPCTVCNPPPRR